MLIDVRRHHPECEPHHSMGWGPRLNTKGRFCLCGCDIPAASRSCSIAIPTVTEVTVNTCSKLPLSGLFPGRLRGQRFDHSKDKHKHCSSSLHIPTRAGCVLHLHPVYCCLPWFSDQHSSISLQPRAKPLISPNELAQPTPEHWPQHHSSISTDHTALLSPHCCPRPFAQLIPLA